MEANYQGGGLLSQYRFSLPRVQPVLLQDLLHPILQVLEVVVDPRSRSNDRVESRSSHVSKSSDRAVGRDPKASPPVSH